MLVGDGKDLQIVLCYHASLDTHTIYFKPEPKKGTKKQLGPEICTHIIFLHAILSCDTTSHLHGILKIPVKSTLS